MKTQEMKWWRWIDIEEEWNISGCYYYPTGIYRPRQHCLMRAPSLDLAFDPVCNEAHISSFHTLVDPIDGMSPPTGPTSWPEEATQLSITRISPASHEQDVSWYFDDELIAGETDDYIVLEYGDYGPLADAGDDQAVECIGNYEGVAHLDGSASGKRTVAVLVEDNTEMVRRPDDKENLRSQREWSLIDAPYSSYRWFEGGQQIGNLEIVDVPLSMGNHDIQLIVEDHSGNTDEDWTTINVRDSLAPVGQIIYPPYYACLGPADTPVVVTDDFMDVCDPAFTRSYYPPGGPSYDDHGNLEVTLSVVDSSGNQAVRMQSFTIDKIPPTVTLLEPADGFVLSGENIPFNIIFESNDIDGANGDVLHEFVTFDGCTVYDGYLFGDNDGHLSDEVLIVDAAELCRIGDLCGFPVLDEPVLTVSATDCGANVGTDSHTLQGTIRLRSGFCDQY
jgi:hypothetical protein